MVNRTLLEVRVLPGASRDAVDGELADGRIRVRLRARAVEGAANDSLVDFVAARLGLARRSVTILRGHRSRQKTLELEGLDSYEARSRLLEDPSRS
jgi:uncharacterized protein (TIGR00251 family)